jgi:hypothetical protein
MEHGKLCKVYCMNYKISWTQTYPAWADYAEKLLELRVELSDNKEAKQIIARIMSL